LRFRLHSMFDNFDHRRIQVVVVVSMLHLIVHYTKQYVDEERHILISIVRC